MDTRKIMYFLKGINANNNRELISRESDGVRCVGANFEEGVDKDWPAFLPLMMRFHLTG